MAKTKKLNLEVPEYLTISKYQEMMSYKGTNSFHRLCFTVATLTGEPLEEVKKWNIESLKKVSDIYTEVASHKELFYPIIEFNGQLYGYRDIRKSSLGEYIDLETYSKDLTGNMNKLAAILYRPIVKTKFNDIVFNIKQGIKVAANEVSNVFDWYTIEDYDTEKANLRSEDYKEFPVHLFLGGLSFFLNSAGLYLNHTAYSEGTMTQKTMKKAEKLILQNLSLNTGAGLGHYLPYLNQPSFN